MEKEILELVDRICSMESLNCRSLNKSGLARKLMDIAGIPMDAIISEISLDWDRQVCVLFYIPNNSYYYELFAGIGTDGKFYFQLSEIATIIHHETGFFDEGGWWNEPGIYFDFYQEHDGMEDKVLSIDYFKTMKV